MILTVLQDGTRIRANPGSSQRLVARRGERDDSRIEYTTDRWRLAKSKRIIRPRLTDGIRRTRVVCYHCAIILCSVYAHRKLRVEVTAVMSALTCTELDATLFVSGLRL